MSDSSLQDYLNRYAARFAFMRQSGAWDLPHPWFECFLPIATINTVLPTIFQEMPMPLGSGHRLSIVAPSKQDTLMMLPDAKQVALFAMLPTSIPPVILPDILQKIESFHHACINAEAKRYISGWLGMMGSKDWEIHFGPRYKDWCNAKATFDPNNIFCSVLFD